MSSGYTSCACRDCMGTAVSDDEDKPDLCNECEEAGCDAEGESECECAPEATCGYCSDPAIGEDDEGNPTCGSETCEPVHTKVEASEP